MKMVFIQSEKCHNDGVSRPPIRDNDLYSTTRINEKFTLFIPPLCKLPVVQTEKITDQIKAFFRLFRLRAIPGL